MSNKARDPWFAYGLGVGSKNAQGAWLEVFFPAPQIGGDAASLQVAAEHDALAKLLGYSGGNQVIEVTAEQLKTLPLAAKTYQPFVDSSRPVVAVFLAKDVAPESVPEAYLKLHLLSHRLVRPHGQNLTGIFKVLPNVAWTNLGAIDPAELPAAQLKARLLGAPLTVRMVDKFPQMIDYVVPSGIRIADGARVRLGAYVGSGTTVMQEGFINFNAGTEGPNMIEGRVSSSVWVGAGSDLGGGCSTMGILSGGNSTPISVGKNCLLGANSGLGIPLGDDCTVESGLYLTAASKVRLVARDGSGGRTVKARELAGRSGLLFRRNSLNGALECLPIKGSIELNADLHDHN